MFSAIHHGDASSAVSLLILILALLCLFGAAWRAWLRDFPAAVALLVVGLVLLVFFD